MNHAVHRLVIHTPEGCSFSLPLAGPISRFLAWALDLLVVVALFLGVSWALSFIAVISRDLAGAIMFLAFFLLWFGYGIVLEWFWGGRTLGKRVLQLRVIDEHGLRLTFWQVVIRNLVRFVDAMPLLYMVGGIACLLTRRSQRLGDLAAGTVVIRPTPRYEPDLGKVMGDKFNSFKAYPHLEARLRLRVAPAQANTALQALMRRDRLDPLARVKLFAELAGYFRALVDFPQAATDGLSDEQYIRNVVDSVLRSQFKEQQKTTKQA